MSGPQYYGGLAPHEGLEYALMLSLKDG